MMCIETVQYQNNPIREISSAPPNPPDSGWAMTLFQRREIPIRMAMYSSSVTINFRFYKFFLCSFQSPPRD